MNKITIIYTYYGQKERLGGIIKEKHPEARVVIVDDGHPDPCPKLHGIDVYRIEEDIPWNQPGARNLGFQESDGWIVCADIDHLVTKGNVKKLLDLDKRKGTIYYLGREDTDSWNIYMIHKDDFEKIGGYDEDFCGHYGYDDTLFNLMAQKNLKVEQVRNIKARVFAKESSSKLERDYAFNQELLKHSLHLTCNEHKRINFKWHKV